jgi:hypothetical protein
VRSPELEALSLRVEEAELDLRLLNALIRIKLAERELAALRIRTEESVGIYRDREGGLAAAAH